MSGFIFLLKNRYLQPAKLQVYAQLYILGGKKGKFDLSALKYMLDFIFLVKKQVLVINKALRLHILGEKTSIHK